MKAGDVITIVFRKDVSPTGQFDKKTALISKDSDGIYTHGYGTEYCVFYHWSVIFSIEYQREIDKIEKKELKQ